MKRPDDGGEAFPALHKFEEYSGSVGNYVAHFEPMGGMSLRDYFAAKALQSLLPLFSTGTLELKSGGRVNEDAIAEQSYAFADAMIKERAK